MMYWSDSGGSVGRIIKASMDGANQTVIHNTNVVQPRSLTLDHQTQTLYWTDAHFQKVESSSVDGTNRSLVAEIGIIEPFGISVYNNAIYISDWSGNTISGVNTIDKTTASLHSLPQCNRPFGIQVVAQLQQSMGKYVLASYCQLH